MVKKTTIKSQVKNKKIIAIKGTEPLPAGDSNLPTNPMVKTYFCNVCNVITSSEGVMYLRWFTKLPGVNLEHCRIAVPIATMKKLADIVSKQIESITPASEQAKKK